MGTAFRRAVTDRHTAEHMHTVCLIGVVEYLVNFGATLMALGAVVTTLVIVRDVHLSLLIDDLIPVKVKAD